MTTSSFLEEIHSPPSFDGTEGLLAIIIHFYHRHEAGMKFITPPLEPMQLGLAKYPKGHKIEPHVHSQIPRTIHGIQEVIFIKRGAIKVDFYTSARQFVCGREIIAGGVLMLVSGGHGFEILEDCEFVEAKLGPHLEGSKVRFGDSHATL